MSAEFLDTSVLVYALDRSSAEKHDQAREVVTRLVRTGRGCLSVQVLQELYWVLTRKAPRPVPAGRALAAVEKLCVLPVFSPIPGDVLAAGRLAEDARISFWDAMIVQAAARMGARILWTEDLNAGQTIAGVLIRSPFRPPMVSEP
jgi:predicted nucleic acid-binding protein